MVKENILSVYHNSTHTMLEKENTTLLKGMIKQNDMTSITAIGLPTEFLLMTQD